MPFRSNAQRKAMFARMNGRVKTIFFAPKHPLIARKIKIDTPAHFKQSVKDLSKDGLSLTEFRSLKLAQARAKAQLNRKNLSSKERKEMKKISKTPIKYVTKAEAEKRNKKIINKIDSMTPEERDILAKEADTFLLTLRDKSGKLTKKGLQVIKMQRENK